MQTSDLRLEFEAGVISFLWRQWARMGLSSTERGREPWAVDPEAVLLLTLRIGQREPRLFDESLDWLAVNGRSISVNRLRSMTSGDAALRGWTDAALAWAGKHNPSLHLWAKRSSDSTTGPVEDAGLLVRDADEDLLRGGLRWPRVSPSGKSMTPDLQDPFNLAFRMRLLFGLGTRAEILRVLLTVQDEGIRAQEAAQATAFSKRNVAESLNALMEARVISAEWHGNERVYRALRSAWMQVLGMKPQEFPTFLNWVPFARALGTLSRWFADGDGLDRTPYMMERDTRSVMDSMEQDLRAARLPIPTTQGGTAGPFWPSFESWVQEVIDLLEHPETWLPS
jgi:hypothetical protein